MPSVQEELEALRSRGVTKKNASKLKDASGLSTPEAEENAIKKEAERTSIANYGKDAENNLKAYNDAKVSVQKRDDATDPGPSKSPTENVAATSTADKDDKNQDDDDDDVPLLEEVPELEEIPSMGVGGDAGEASTGAAVPSGPPATREVNRAERKARRMMEKLGMKKTAGISQVVIKMSESGGRGGVYTIATPDVYEKNGSYVVFGEARQGGSAGGASAAAPAANGDKITQAQQAEAIQQLAAMAKSGGGADTTGGGVNEGLKIEEITDEEAAVDDSGLDAKDIDLVITQAGCSRAKAVKALKENDGDLVNAIMSLTA